MVALVSPGVSITVIDESQYLPTAVGSIPFVLFASGENKVINGAIAPGTKKANAGKVYGISSQRELVATFGTPKFYTSAAGTPLHGNELNEYGLMAAYSALGLGNRVWAIRADINLDELVGTTVRPVGAVPDSTNWFDTADTEWGIYEYNQTTDTFKNIVPLVIDNWNDITVNAGVPTPNESLGKIGSYAVVVRDANNYVFYKNMDNVWVQVGSQDWQASFAAVTGTNSSPDFTNGGDFSINGVTITVPAGLPDCAAVATIINAANIPGVEAGTMAGFLQLMINDLSQSDGVNADGAMSLADGANGVLAEMGIAPSKYYDPTLYFGSFNQNPDWGTMAPIPRPTGSVWLKTSVSGKGANFVFKQYNAALKTWTKLATPVYGDGYKALFLSLIHI